MGKSRYGSDNNVDAAPGKYILYQPSSIPWNDTAITSSKYLSRWNKMLVGESHGLHGAVLVSVSLAIGRLLALKMSEFLSGLDKTTRLARTQGKSFIEPSWITKSFSWDTKHWRHVLLCFRSRLGGKKEADVIVWI
jgi:hypothetical protein